MGLNISKIKLLIRLGQYYDFKGSILTLGVQQVHANYDQVEKCFIENNYDILQVQQTERKVEGTLFNENATIIEKEHLHPETLFKMLGFSEYSTLDFYDNEGASIVHDLNTIVPNKLYDSFDLILDSGVTSHIANPLKVFENMARMCKVNGKVVHILGIEGWCNHGFYSVSPCLLYEFYHVNGFSDMKSYLLRTGGILKKKDEFKEYIYDIKMLNCQKPFCRTFLVFAAKKTRNVLSIQTPIQGSYLEKFADQRARDSKSLLPTQFKPASTFILRVKRRWFDHQNSRFFARVFLQLKEVYSYLLFTQRDFKKL